MNAPAKQKTLAQPRNNRIAARINALDWRRIVRDLDASGSAVTQS